MDSSICGDTVYDYSSTAIEVYTFLSGLPELLAKFIYKRIVEQQYAIAKLVPYPEAKVRLLSALYDSLNYKSTMDPIYSFLGIDDLDVRHTLDELLAYNKKVEWIAQMVDLTKCADSLPDSDCLVSLFHCFSGPSLMEYADQFKDYIALKLIDIGDSVNSVARCGAKDIADNLFSKIGFLSRFDEFYSSDENDNSDLQLVSWYCRGELLDAVIDTIFTCGVTEVAQALWLNLETFCRDHYSFRNVLQHRYDEYRKISIAPEHIFVFEGVEPMIGSRDSDAEALAKPLDPIPVSYDNNQSMSETQLEELWYKLKNGKYIECDVDTFKMVFSGQKWLTLDKTIVWLRKANELATFLMVVRAKKKASNSRYSQEASLVFVNKNGERFSALTLNQPDGQSDEKKKFAIMFNDINGVKRK